MPIAAENGKMLIAIHSILDCTVQAAITADVNRYAFCNTVICTLLKGCAKGASITQYGAALSETI